jgi:hypothetical protein
MRLGISCGAASSIVPSANGGFQRLSQQELDALTGDLLEYPTLSLAKEKVPKGGEGRAAERVAARQRRLHFLIPKDDPTPLLQLQ